MSGFIRWLVSNVSMGMTGSSSSFVRFWFKATPHLCHI